MTINDIFKIYAPEYINRFGDLIPSDHRKVIDAIINARNAAKITLSTNHAATDIVPTASITRPINGS